ncbi:MAG: hypothetical protein J7K73_00455 [Nanoarchaeota archaeon]|nr:hypothetical protein [Nanoarchaeota archaeon]
MVFADKSLEECLEEIEFDAEKLIKIELSEYQRKHIKLFTGEDPGEYIPPSKIYTLSPLYRKVIHKRILEGECLEIQYSSKVSLDSYVSEVKDVARIGMMFLEELPRDRDIDISFFSEVFTNSIEWGNDNEGELNFNIWVTKKGSIISITQKKEWNYQKYIEDFKKGTAKPRGGGAGMTVIDRVPYEVGYTNNGRTTYVLITKEMITKSIPS